MALQSCLAVITKTFREMDTNKDGFLDGFEVEAVFKKYHEEMGQPIGWKQLKEEVSDFMKNVDDNGDKKISLGEFLDYFLRFQRK